MPENTTVDVDIENIAIFCNKKYWIAETGTLHRKTRKGTPEKKVTNDRHVLEDLEKKFTHMTAMSLIEQADYLNEVKALMTSQQSVNAGAITDAYTVEEVDPWAADILEAFRWYSSGTSVQCFFHAHYLMAWLTEKNTAKVKKEITLISSADVGLSIALQQHPRAYNMLKKQYDRACKSGNPGITPKRVADGRYTYYNFRDYLTQQRGAWLADTRYSVPVEPATLSEDPKEWTFFHFNRAVLAARLAQQTQEGSVPTTPTWSRWLLKLQEEENSELFRAWLYSVFVPTNKGRQVLWIEDNGGGGKGTIARVIQAFMKNVGCGAISKSMTDSQFGASYAYGKRLLIHSDCKNPRLLSTGLVHQITGGDAVLVERKHEQAFTAILHSKVMVMANISPEVDMYNTHESSRIIHMRLDPTVSGADQSHRMTGKDGRLQLVGDASWESKLRAEFPDFLAQCEQYYKKLCPTGSNLIVHTNVHGAMDLFCASTEQVYFETFVASYLEVDRDDPDMYITPKDLLDLFTENVSRKKTDYSNFIKYLESAHGARKIKREVDGSQKRVMLGVAMS